MCIRDRAAGLQIFLVLHARFAEMDLGINDTRQDMEAARVDGLARKALSDMADGANSAISDANVGGSFAVLIDDGSAFEHNVERLGHGCGAVLAGDCPRS